MFIIWGTKQVERKQGWVAEYCPICDEARVCRLIELKTVSHLYYVPLGRGKPIGHVCQCKTCKNQFGVDESQYVNVSEKRPESLEALVDQTNPELVSTMAKVMDLRDRVAAGDGSEEERQALLYHPFTAIILPVAERGQHINVDGVSALWLLAIFMLPLVAFLIVESLPASMSHPDASMYAAFSVLGLLALGFLYSVATDTTRFTRDTFRWKIVKRLAPLNPTLAELEEVLGNLKQDPDYRVIGKAFKAHRLLERITREREEKNLENESLAAHPPK